MKISKISVYQVDLPLHEGSYKWSGGKSVSVFDSTIVRIDTDEGIVGYGEVCPLGPFYLPAYAAGCRAGIKELAPHLIGDDPLQLDKLNRWMDAALKGHPYVKSAIDMACWDILGQVAVSRSARCSAADMATISCSIGQFRRRRRRRWRRAWQAIAPKAIDAFNSRSAAIRTSISRASMPWRRKLQPGDKLVADANTGWLMHEALRVVRAVRDVDVYIEQPCLTYEECLSIRRRPIIRLSSTKSIDGVDVLLRGRADLAMDVVNIKISKFGGLSKARQARDLCVALGIAMTIEDSWGGDITTAAIAHLAHSTPTEFLFTATDFNSYVTVSTAEGAPQRANGRMAASTAPGLGIQPRLDVLGSPVLEID